MTVVTIGEEPIDLSIVSISRSVARFVDYCGDRETRGRVTLRRNEGVFVREDYHLDDTLGWWCERGILAVRGTPLLIQEGSHRGHWWSLVVLQRGPAFTIDS